MWRGDRGIWDVVSQLIPVEDSGIVEYSLLMANLFPVQ
jgi:hypothetical protein